MTETVAPRVAVVGGGIAGLTAEEIDEAERRRRERESMEVMTEAFAERYPDDPTMHPSVLEKRKEDE